MGLPISLAISTVYFVFYDSHKDIAASKLELASSLALSVVSALFAVVALIFFHLALQCEDATKVAIVKCSDVLFSFLLQFFILDVPFNTLSLIGTAFILLATCSLVLLKVTEKMFAKNNTCLVKIIFHKI